MDAAVVRFRKIIAEAIAAERSAVPTAAGATRSTA